MEAFARYNVSYTTFKVESVFCAITKPLILTQPKSARIASDSPVILQLDAFSTQDVPMAFQYQQKNVSETVWNFWSGKTSVIPTITGHPRTTAAHTPVSLGTALAP